MYCISWRASFPIEHELIDILFPGQPPALLDADKTGTDKLNLETIKATSGNTVSFGGARWKCKFAFTSGF